MERVEHLAERTNATILVAACTGGCNRHALLPSQGWHGWIGVVFWIAVVAAVTDPVRTLWGLHK